MDPYDLELRSLADLANLCCTLLLRSFAALCYKRFTVTLDNNPPLLRFTLSITVWDPTIPETSTESGTTRSSERRQWEISEDTRLLVYVTSTGYAKYRYRSAYYSSKTLRDERTYERTRSNRVSLCLSRRLLSLRRELLSISFISFWRGYRIFCVLYVDSFFRPRVKWRDLD